MAPSFWPADSMPPASAASGDLPVRSEVYLDHGDDGIRLGNGRIELTVGAGNGHIRRIRGLDTGVEHKGQDDGTALFELTVGSRENPAQSRARIAAGTHQEMPCRFDSLADGGKRLRLEYPMLVDDATRKPTGVGIGVTIELAPASSHFVIRAEIANNGPLWLTRLSFGCGELLTGDDDRAAEEVWLPCHGGASHEDFSHASIGLPTYAWGWTDYSGSRGGIGVAYVNRQGIQWCLDWQKSATGLSSALRFFDLSGYWHFEEVMSEQQRALLLQPLEPGSMFTTDEWLLIPHAGGWHETADVYRSHFSRAFGEDGLTWDRLPERARELDLYAGCWVAENEIGNRYPRGIYNHLDTVAPQISDLLAASGTDPSHLGVGLTWFQAQVGRYPDFFPVCEEAGGEAAWDRMMRALRQLEVSFVGGYTHLSYHHPAARQYVPEAGVDDTVPWVNPTVGDRACVDNSAWHDLWREELIPDYRRHGLDMVFMDEGHFPWGTCAAHGAAHLHGPSSVGILTSNTRGVVHLHRLFREGLGPDGILMIEGSGDVTGRWVDLHFAYRNDPSITYTLPARRYGRVITALHAGNTAAVRAAALPGLRRELNAVLAGGEFAIVGLQHDVQLEGMEELHRYCQIRQRLRDDSAPGYPQGYRHTKGLEVGDDAIEAAAFVGTTGVTVLFYATSDVRSEIRVDGEAVGHPGIGRQPRLVDMIEGELDFWVLTI